jgi:ABC-2 type transport system ATP-binding protein
MLEVHDVTKRFYGSAVVSGLTLRIAPGEVLGLLGPNGAGKTTTLKMLTGLLEPSAGTIRYAGQDVHEDLVGYKQRIGYVPEEPSLYPYLSGREYLELVGRLRGLAEARLAAKIDAFLRLFALPETSVALEAYSKGMRQKVLIAAAILHDPEIVFFDEAESGLDVGSALMFRALVRMLAEKGKIVIYSSHVLEVVEKVCSRVALLERGRLVADDSVERLRVLMDRPSLEGVFRLLLQREDVEETAAQAMRAAAS